MKAVFLFALVASASAASAVPRPVTRVVNLLKDMQAQLEADAKKDQEIYDKLSCWCSNNDSGKSKAIDEAEMNINNLVAKGEELAAKSAQLAAEIKALNEEIQKNVDSLNKATEIRKKEQADFNDKEKDLLHSIDLLGKAVETLKSFNGGGAKKAGLITLTTNLRASLRPMMTDFAEKLTPMQMTVVTQFLQGFQDGYANQSGEVFGVLQQMKEDMEQDLDDATKAEQQAQQDFEKMKASKLQARQQAQDRVDEKTQQKATADSDAAAAAQLLDETRNSLGADQKFLMELKKKCQETDDQWDKRQKDRALEMKSVQEAISVLNSPEAFDTFSRTLTKQHGENTQGADPAAVQAFVQLHARTSEEKREAAAAYLKKMSRQLNSPKLALLANSVELRVLDKVIAMIEKIVVQLKKDQADQETQWDACRKDLADNAQNRLESKNHKDELKTKIDNLDADIKTLTSEIADLDASIANSLSELKKATEQRNAENLEFQTVYSDQQATKSLLNQAKEKLAPAYGGALIQGKFMLKQAPKGGATVENAPPEGFSEYKKGAGSSVIALLDQIINEATDLQKQAVTGEQESQTAYNTLAGETQDSIKNDRKEKETKEKSKASKETQRAATKDEHKTESEELANLQEENDALHKSCDWLVKNYETSQTARSAEIDALNNAAAILKGA